MVDRTALALSGFCLCCETAKLDSPIRKVPPNGSPCAKQLEIYRFQGGLRIQDASSREHEGTPTQFLPESTCEDYKEVLDCQVDPFNIVAEGWQNPTLFAPWLLALFAGCSSAEQAWTAVSQFRGCTPSLLKDCHYPSRIASLDFVRFVTTAPQLLQDINTRSVL